MIRRSLLLVGLLILSLTLGLGVVGAQDQQPLWDFGDAFLVKDYGFGFLQPDGWLTDSSDVATYFASTKADLKAMADSDQSTNPENPAFQLATIALTAVGLDTTSSLDSAVDAMVAGVGITETENRVDLALMGRRSVSVIGTDDQKRQLVITVWIQDGTLVLMGVDAGDSLSAVDVAFSWGRTLSTLTPLGAADLSADPITGAKTGVTFAYPDGWFLNSDIGLAFEDKTDFKNSKVTHSIVALIETPLSDLELTKKPDSADLIAAMTKNYQIENSKLEEFVLAGQPAYGIEGADSSGTGQYGLIVVTVVNGYAVQAIVIAPSEEEFNALKPTFLTALQSSAAAA